jgi:hypothetical protein
MKNSHSEEKVLKGGGRQNKEVKKVNMGDALAIQE